MVKIASGLHTDFLGPVETILGALDKVYPRARLAEVRLFEKQGDRSLAHVEGRDIVLNALWFTRPRVVLDEAGSDGRACLPYGMPLWHAGIPEPEHVLTHEFWHVLATALSGSVKFMDAGHAAVLADPAIAVSGYSLTDRDEWGAETFAVLRLGHAASVQVAEMEKFLIDESGT